MRVFDTECETLMEDQIIGAKEDLGPIEKEQFNYKTNYSYLQTYIEYIVNFLQ